jgi:DNA-binding HxlR family transcriptional regulator
MTDQIQSLPNCSLARALSVVGERWSLLIVREAIMGSTRFDEFHQRLGVARNILQSRLVTLVEAGILTRDKSEANARIPLYTLTEKGWQLFPALAGLMQWGDRWMDGGKGAPVLLLAASGDAEIQPVELRDGAGRSLDPRLIALKPGPGANAQTRRRMQKPIGH